MKRKLVLGLAFRVTPKTPIFKSWPPCFCRKWRRPRSRKCDPIALCRHPSLNRSFTPFDVSQCQAAPLYTPKFYGRGWCTQDSSRLAWLGQIVEREHSFSPKVKGHSNAPVVSSRKSNLLHTPNNADAMVSSEFICTLCVLSRSSSHLGPRRHSTPYSDEV